MYIDISEFGGTGGLNGKCSARGPRKMSEAIYIFINNASQKHENMVENIFSDFVTFVEKTFQKFFSTDQLILHVRFFTFCINILVCEFCIIIWACAIITRGAFWRGGKNDGCGRGGHHGCGGDQYRRQPSFKVFHFPVLPSMLPPCVFF